MEKNLLKAIVLSAAILLGWQFFASRFVAQPQPAQMPQQQVSTPAEAPVAPPSTPASAPTGEPVTAPATVEPERSITVETSRWVAKFTNRGGVPTSWKLVRGPNGEAITSADGSELELFP